MKYDIAPSILSADFMHLQSQIAEVEKAGAQILHFDVMDGMFVNNISFGIPVLKCIKGRTDMMLDVHLMIVEPDRYIEKFKEAGADTLTVHIETLDNPEETFNRIKKAGMRPSVSLNPETPIENVFPYLEFVDQVLIMTVHPGAGAQAYISECTEKIRKLREEVTRKKLNTDIEVDGGINMDTIDTVIDAGANVFVMGSSVFNDNPYESAKKYIDKLALL